MLKRFLNTIRSNRSELPGCVSEIEVGRGSVMPTADEARGDCRATVRSRHLPYVY